MRKQERSFVTSVQHSRRRDQNRNEHGDPVVPAAQDYEPKSPVVSSSSSCTEPDPASPSTPEPLLAEAEVLICAAKAPTKALQARIRHRPALKRSVSHKSSPAVQVAVLDVETSPSLMRNLLQDPSDPLRPYAQLLEIPESSLWDHYLWQERQHGAQFRKFRQFDNLAPRFLHPLILANPAMLASTVLFTACHLRYTKVPSAETITSAILKVHSLAYNYLQTVRVGNL